MYANTDNLSFVTKVSFGDMDYLLMSDARVESENDIYLAYGASGLLNNIEVLSIADGGSATGITTSFTKFIKPSAIIISAGEQDIANGNPSSTELATLQTITSDVYVTNTSGTIEIMSDGTSDYNIFITH